MPVAASPPNPAAEDPTDPADWPSVLTDRIRTQLVCRGPSEVPPNFVFPRNESDGRSCHPQYIRKTLVSCENIPRSWLVYSERNNSHFCFCCKLFSEKKINFANSGLTDWKHARSLLTSHDSSPEHQYCMKTCKELAMRIKKGETIDKHEMALMEAERTRWTEVLTCLTDIVQSLANRNLALRGHTETLYSPSNGHFLKEVELMAQFDPVMKEHLNSVQKETLSHTTSYLGHQIQNEVEQQGHFNNVNGLQCYGCNIIQGQRYVDIGCSNPEVITCTHSHKGFKHRFCIKTESTLGIVLTSGCATSRHCQQQELPGVRIHCCTLDLCNSTPCCQASTLHYIYALASLLLLWLWL
ncbi:uncharacterized protein LOC129818449 isoform X2 [Salvelinus fontinalis]|uniref:uncharacterized protein LOC129818449 isoform X2 n=1 Tax=Salvelinus fontinalis TaxID=8038 RepID=UPI0024857DFD|nr:uncharacterized protein LOC129818449 isoform X2 [Salvelinus fontinalis]